MLLQFSLIIHIGIMRFVNTGQLFVYLNTFAFLDIVLMHQVFMNQSKIKSINSRGNYQENNSSMSSDPFN